MGQRKSWISQTVSSGRPCRAHLPTALQPVGHPCASRGDSGGLAKWSAVMTACDTSRLVTPWGVTSAMAGYKVMQIVGMREWMVARVGLHVTLPSASIPASLPSAHQICGPHKTIFLGIANTAKIMFTLDFGKHSVGNRNHPGTSIIAACHDTEEKKKTFGHTTPRLLNSLPTGPPKKKTGNI